MRANEIGALPDALARQPHCLVVIEPTNWA
jgi:hypothetical protein